LWSSQSGYHPENNLAKFFGYEYESSPKNRKTESFYIPLLATKLWDLSSKSGDIGGGGVFYLGYYFHEKSFVSGEITACHYQVFLYRPHVAKKRN